jgi:hypothetical protein
MAKNITREKGDTKRISLTMRDKNGVVIPINTWTNFRMHIDKYEYPIDDENNIHTANGAFTTNGIDGKFYFPVNGTLEKGTYYYEMKAINASGETVTFASGKYFVTLHGNVAEPVEEVDLVCGESFFIGWRFKWDEDTPQDLTGYNILIQIKPFNESQRPIIQYTQLSPELTLALPYGAIDLNIPASTTSTFTFKKAVIDCYVTNAAGTLGFRSPFTKITNTRGVSRNANN